MKIYFERLLICDKCGRIERQTANWIPLDWIGRSLDKMQRREFKYKCKINSCNSKIRYTPWKLAKIFYNDLKI